MSYPDANLLLSLRGCMDPIDWALFMLLQSLPLPLLGLHILSITLIFLILFVAIIRELRTKADNWQKKISLDRTLQAQGAFLGPLLFFTIFSGLALYYLKKGSFSWDFSTEWNALYSIKMIAFLLFWIHWAWREVVFMDGIRKHWPEDGSEPSQTYKEGHTRVYRSLKILLLQGIGIIILSILAHASSPTIPVLILF